MMEGDSFFKDVGVEVIFDARGLGTRDVEDVTELSQEESVVRALGSTRLLPARYEALRIVRHCEPCYDERAANVGERAVTASRKAI